MSADQYFVLRDINTFDGQKPYALMHTFSESPVPVEIPKDKPMFLNISAGRTTEAYFGPWYFSGIRLWGAPHVGLANLFRNNLISLHGTETIDNVTCVVAKAESQNWKYTFWLDPTRDYLPRKQEAQLIGSPTTPEVLSVSEFQQYDDGIGNKRWMPSVARATSDILIHHYVLKDLTLNGEYSDSDFSIAPETLPPGIQVNEGAKTWYTGDRKDLFVALKELTDRRDAIMDEAHAKFLAEQHGTLPTTESTPIRVEKTNPLSWTTVVVFFSGGALVLLGAYRWWQRRQEQ